MLKYRDLRWKVEEYRELKISGIRRSLLNDLLSRDYRRESRALWDDMGRRAAESMGTFFSPETPSWALEEIYFKRIYEVDGFIPSKGDRVIDIGASYGDSAIWWAKVYDAYVIAFEPLKDVFVELEKNVKLNNLEKKIEIYNTALGSGHYVKGERNGNMLSLSNDGIPVETRKLDEFNFSNIKIIKIDVEGYEVEVLNGALKTIEINRPLVIIETHSRKLRKETDLFLRNLGYTLRAEKDKRYSGGWMDEVVNLFYSPQHT